MQYSSGIPNLAGICTLDEAVRRGLSIEDNITMLKRFYYMKTKLYNIMVHHMNRTPEWEVKGALSLHLWLDAEHASLLRKRVSEMREPPLHLDKVPDERLALVMEEVLRAETTVELLSGLLIIRESLMRGYREHHSRTNLLVDHPTSRILKWIASEETEMLEWLIPALQALMTNEQLKEEGLLWTQHIVYYLQASRGVSGTEEGVSEHRVILPTRSNETYEVNVVPQRDGRFKDLYNTVLTADVLYLDPTIEPKERVWALFYKRLREMDVPEMQCSIVAETPGRKWDYYLDMGRQIWDEARHSMMGEAAFIWNEVDWTQLPIRINFSLEMNTLLTPEERHAILYEIEFGLMPAEAGKKYEWEVSKESGNDLAVTYHDYDWADEVLHAQIGRKWIVESLGGVQNTLELAKRARQKLDKLRPNYVSEDKEWWNHFYDQVRAKPLKAAIE